MKLLRKLGHFNTITKSAKFLQLLFSLYILFILPKIPFKIILKIVEMPQNVEYYTFPLNKNVKF